MQAGGGAPETEEEQVAAGAGAGVAAAGGGVAGLEHPDWMDSGAKERECREESGGKG